ncbi:hypothetical protein diail_11226 [Diaporthe ilicicola]|nr:hypothetical protein diail_11226 [Diaporthe ilicicola]
MYPTAAQGYSLIVEDIGVLDYLASKTPNPEANMKKMGDDWQNLRKTRCERIKAWSNWNMEVFSRPPPQMKTSDSGSWQYKSLKDTVPDMNARLGSSSFLKWAQGIDAIEEVSPSNREVPADQAVSTPIYVIIWEAKQDFRAYEFVSNYDPTPQVVGDSTYPVQAFGSFLCRATAVGAFSDQTATLTVSTAPLITTEVPWDYDVDMILAYPANINRYIYEGSGTTSECFGRCPETSNPLAPPTPTPTFAPTNSYVSPPSHATTQFTPAPSCLSDPNLWLVSTSCQLLDNNQIETPPWLECAITEFGEPNVSNEACYPGGSATAGDDETTSFYVDCPAGYTTASETTYRPFDETQYGETPRATVSYDVVASAVMCCPDVENYSFQYSDVTTTTTTHDYRSYDVHMYPMPFCVATSVEALSGRDVELTLTVDTRVWDKKKRQEETSAPAVTIRPWDYEGGLLFAQAAGAAVTVFHGTYTCLESCSEYFTYSYNNTDPNYTPPPSTTSTAASSISAAEPTTTTSGAGESVVTGEATGSVVFTGSGNQLCETKPGTAALTVAVLMLLYRAML